MGISTLITEKKASFKTFLNDIEQMKNVSMKQNKTLVTQHNTEMQQKTQEYNTVNQKLQKEIDALKKQRDGLRTTLKEKETVHMAFIEEKRIEEIKQSAPPIEDPELEKLRAQLKKKEKEMKTLQKNMKEDIIKHKKVIKDLDNKNKKSINAIEATNTKNIIELNQKNKATTEAMKNKLKELHKKKINSLKETLKGEHAINLEAELSILKTQHKGAVSKLNNEIEMLKKKLKQKERQLISYNKKGAATFTTSNETSSNSHSSNPNSSVSMKETKETLTNAFNLLNKSSELATRDTSKGMISTSNTSSSSWKGLALFGLITTCLVVMLTYFSPESIGLVHNSTVQRQLFNCQGTVQSSASVHSKDSKDYVNVNQMNVDQQCNQKIQQASASASASASAVKSTTKELNVKHAAQLKAGIAKVNQELNAKHASQMKKMKATSASAGAATSQTKALNVKHASQLKVVHLKLQKVMDECSQKMKNLNTNLHSKAKTACDSKIKEKEEQINKINTLCATNTKAAIQNVNQKK